MELGDYRLNICAMALRLKDYTKQTGRCSPIRRTGKPCCCLQSEKAYSKWTDLGLLVTARSRSCNKDKLEGSLPMIHHLELGIVAVTGKYLFSSVSLLLPRRTR